MRHDYQQQHGQQHGHHQQLQDMCHQYHLHFIQFQTADGQMHEGILEDYDQEGMTILMPDGDSYDMDMGHMNYQHNHPQYEQRQFGYGPGFGPGPGYGRRRFPRRFRRFRRHRYPFPWLWWLGLPFFF
ncbi:hypothetical protein [Salsuginibacillus kocurii]|uniref:hypothetical protein n=1 Tax=Salsuginibacillus kocurii TaxID=427078 RepID=UPI0003757325|nr:hypothetical protein [Salsuginibacillus kocurii]